jgi:replicative DNA helicase
MDLDRNLLWALLVSRDHYDRIVGTGIGPMDCDLPEARRAFGFIADHVRDYGTLPGTVAVVDLCGVTPEDPGTDPGYVLAEVRSRKLFRQLREGIENAMGAMRGNDPGGALTNLQALVESSAVQEQAPPKTLFAAGADVVSTYERMLQGYVGVPYPWPSMTAMTQGMWPGTLTMFVGRPGMGKCARYDTPVMCAETGVYKTIAEVVRGRERVFTRHLDGRIQAVTPDAFLPMGTKECRKLTTHGGRELSATPEHPVWTVDGWRRMDELQVGDYVAVPRVVPEPERPIAPGPHEPELIAALLADGGLTNTGIFFTKKDAGVVERVRAAVEHFGGELNKTSAEGPTYTVRRVDGVQGHGANPIGELLKAWGVGRVLSKHKTIPDRVFQYDNQSLARFLGMLWSCDGSFPTLKTRRGESYYVAELGLASREMVYQVQRLMLRFGVHGRIRFKPVKLDGAVFDSWTFTINATCHQAFREALPIVGAKAAKCARLMDAVNPNLDNVPILPQLKAALQRIVGGFTTSERVRRYAQMSAALGMTTFTSVDKVYRRRTVSRRTFAAFVEAFEAHALRPILDCAWDEIVRLEDDGAHEVYDLTVMGTHSFVANDLVVHNSVTLVLLAQHAWKEAGRRVLIISPEMSRLEVAERFFAVQAHVSQTGLVRGTLTEFELQRLKRVVTDLSASDGIWIMDQEDDLSPRSIEARIRAIHPDVVLLDTLYNLKVPGNRFERTERVLEWSLNMAKRHQFALVAFSQQNRNQEVSAKLGGGTRLGTIAFSDQVGMDAHAVFAMEQDADMKLDRRMRYVPLKIRRGYSEGPVETNWDFTACNFTEIQKSGRVDYNDDGFKPGPVAALPAASPQDDLDLPF